MRLVDESEVIGEKVVGLFGLLYSENFDQRTFDFGDYVLSKHHLVNARRAEREDGFASAPTRAHPLKQDVRI